MDNMPIEGQVGVVRVCGRCSFYLDLAHVICRFAVTAITGIICGFAIYVICPFLSDLRHYLKLICYSRFIFNLLLWGFILVCGIWKMLFYFVILTYN